MPFLLIACLESSVFFSSNYACPIGPFYHHQVSKNSVFFSTLKFIASYIATTVVKTNQNMPNDLYSKYIGTLLEGNLSQFSIQKLKLWNKPFSGEGLANPTYDKI